MSELIQPKELIARMGTDALCKTAETYFSSIEDPTPQMLKPFDNPQTVGQSLQHMGLLLSGLRLGKAMTVLDFGAGTCWFSKFLNDLECMTVSVDPSPTALEIGRKVFARSQPLREPLAEPRFVEFDGYTFDVEDNSIDRIISFDAFHHVPNQEQVIREMYRVLKPGGIVGFSEPGRNHSQSAQSQYEMRNYNVLENDILLDEIKSFAESIGFGEFRFKMIPAAGHDFSWDIYRKLTMQRFVPLRLARHLLNILSSSAKNTSIFYLTKGTWIDDSRRPQGLAHTLEIGSLENEIDGIAGETITIPLTITNTGSGKWLHSNARDIGAVRVGAHLRDSGNQLLNIDFGRKELPHSLLPGETIQVDFPVILDTPGKWIVEFDMVSESVCWFELSGSKAQSITFNVR